MERPEALALLEACKQLARKLNWVDLVNRKDIELNDDERAALVGFGKVYDYRYGCWLHDPSVYLAAGLERSDIANLRRVLIEFFAEEFRRQKAMDEPLDE